MSLCVTPGGSVHAFVETVNVALTVLRPKREAPILKLRAVVSTATTRSKVNIFML